MKANWFPRGLAALAIVFGVVTGCCRDPGDKGVGASGVGADAVDRVASSDQGMTREPATANQAERSASADDGAEEDRLAVTEPPIESEAESPSE